MRIAKHLSLGKSSSGYSRSTSSVSLLQATAIMALLQPSPEVFQLFDDVMLLSDGMCVYYGPREGILPFFESQGFRCPPRMPVPGFLQNITSRRDQQVSCRLPRRRRCLISETLTYWDDAYIACIG